MPRRTAIVFHLTACRRSVLQLEQRQLLGDLAADIVLLIVEEPFTDSFFYLKKRLFSFLQLCFERLRSEFQCRNFIFSGSYPGFSSYQGTRGILQLAFSFIDDLTPRVFSDFKALFGNLRSLNCALANGLRPSFRFPYQLFHSTKMFGSLKHEIQHRLTAITR
jgi:hypothetical protein